MLWSYTRAKTGVRRKTRPRTKIESSYWKGLFHSFLCLLVFQQRTAFLVLLLFYTVTICGSYKKSALVNASLACSGGGDIFYQANSLFAKTNSFIASFQVPAPFSGHRRKVGCLQIHLLSCSKFIPRKLLKWMNRWGCCPACDKSDLLLSSKV